MYIFTLALSVGDVIRLNRMYECPNFEVPTINSNGRSLDEMEVQSSNESNIGAETNKMVPSNDTSMDINKDELKTSESNSTNENKDHHDDDEDDMILSEEQIEELYSTKAAKRVGLKSDFFMWPKGIVPFQINASFCKTFSFFFIP